MRVVRRSLAVLLLATCAFLAAYIAFRTSHPAAPSAAAQSTAAGGADNGQEQASAAGSAEMPETLPDVRVPDLTGQSKSIRDFTGHPLIVNFWATWCEPCRREMPLLEQLQHRDGPAGLQILGIAVDSRPAVEQYLKARPVSYPILADENAGSEAMSRFGNAPALPFSVFADAQGRILLVKLGELHADEADFILSTAREVEAGHETLQQGRTAIESKLRDLAVARAKANRTS